VFVSVELEIATELSALFEKVEFIFTAAFSRFAVTGSLFASRRAESLIIAPQLGQTDNLTALFLLQTGQFIVLKDLIVRKVFYRSREIKRKEKLSG
jgi:hypothetical protein